MRERILGLELLRGLCALLVALFHCFMLSGVAHFETWGWYGVYVFFGISGAVLYYNYHATLSLAPSKPGDLSIPGFLLKRYARLAPLYAFCVFIPVLLHNLWIPDLYYLNASLLFGFASPGKTSAVTGGWSLGIEFALYAMFPTLIAFTRSTRSIALTLTAFLALRMALIHHLLKDGPLVDSWAIYTQTGSFLFFFFGGMAIARLMTQGIRRPAVLAGVGAVCAVLLFGWPSGTADSVISGWLGAGYSILSLLIVAGFFWSPTFTLGAAVSRFFGEISYGLYLLHPIIWFSSVRHWPGMGVAERTVMVITSASAAAWLLSRLYERPVRRWILRRSGPMEIYEHSPVEKGGRIN